MDFSLEVCLNILRVIVVRSWWFDIGGFMIIEINYFHRLIIIIGQVRSYWVIVRKKTSILEEIRENLMCYFEKVRESVVTVGVVCMSEGKLMEGYDVMRKKWKVVLFFVEDRSEGVHSSM